MGFEQEAAAREWYHTIELAPGVETPGWFDLRELIGQVPFPVDLSGKRCLDVGTFDGFWAFEMERRGAAEVVAIDVIDPPSWDWPIGSQAEVNHGDRPPQGARARASRSPARRSACRSSAASSRSTTSTRPTSGSFDFVFVGSLLLHLRDPVRALERARGVVADGGRLMSLDAVSPRIEGWFGRRPVAIFDGIGRPWWWHPNARCLATMLDAAGLRVVEGPVKVHMPRGAGQPVRFPRNPLRLLRSAGRGQARLALKGDPHAAYLCEPL